MTDFRALLQALGDGGVEFILIGGVAATVHGSARLTQDVDVVYGRSAANLDRLVAALAPHHPYLRDAPRGLPFQFDRETVARGLNFTLVTDIGDIDLFGEVAGGGAYNDLVRDSLEIEVFGTRCRCVGLDRLVALKRAAGRPKDLEAIAELEAIREERDRTR